MTNKNPIKPGFILTVARIEEILDRTDFAFRHSGNIIQARKEETDLLKLFVRQTAIKGGVRQPKDCAEILIKKARFILFTT